MYTDHPAAFAEAQNPLSRGTHYFQDALRLWQLEEGHSKLTNLQGLTILIVWYVSQAYTARILMNSLSMVYMGKDRMALLHGAQLRTLRNNIYLKVRHARKSGSGEYSDLEFQRSWSYAAWSSFKIEVYALLPLLIACLLTRTVK